MTDELEQLKQRRDETHKDMMRLREEYCHVKKKNLESRNQFISQEEEALSRSMWAETEHWHAAEKYQQALKAKDREKNRQKI